MFGIVDNRQSEYGTALYFNEYPQLPLKESGERFKFKNESNGSRMQDPSFNMGNLSTQKTISTTYKIEFKVEGYVLIGKTLYRIMDVGSSLVSPQTARILKSPLTKQILILNRVSNALDLEV